MQPTLPMIHLNCCWWYLVQVRSGGMRHQWVVSAQCQWRQCTELSMKNKRHNAHKPTCNMDSNKTNLGDLFGACACKTWWLKCGVMWL